MDVAAPRAGGDRPALADLRALVLTHAHFDHVGFAPRAQSELELPVFCGGADHPLAAHPLKGKTERPWFLYAWRPAAAGLVARMIGSGILWARGLEGLHTLEPGEVLDGLPGRPRVIAVPGHTLGSVAFHFQDRDTVITGDALVTRDPYTGATGPRLVARAATAMSRWPAPRWTRSRRRTRRSCSQATASPGARALRGPRSWRAQRQSRERAPDCGHDGRVDARIVPGGDSPPWVRWRWRPLSSGSPQAQAVVTQTAAPATAQAARRPQRRAPHPSPPSFQVADGGCSPTDGSLPSTATRATTSRRAGHRHARPSGQAPPQAGQALQPQVAPGAARDGADLHHGDRRAR